MRRATLPLLVALLAAALPERGRGGEVGFVEPFALAPDRADPLRLLVPGTDDHYYYHALHAVNTERFEQARQLVTAWTARLGRTPRVAEVETRLALLGYSRDPKATLAFLRDRLNLRFDHRREVPGAVPDLPTRLDPASIGRAALTAAALRVAGDLGGFEDAALDRLAATDLDPARRRNLLQRLRRPDLPNLAKLVDADLRAEHSGPFGSLPVHAQLTVAQLDELAGLHPDVLNQPAFVAAYTAKLQPGADEVPARDRAAQLAHLERLERFADRLAPVHNPLKAHVLFHRLQFDRAGGTYDKPRFLRYLALPRRQPYMAPKLNEAADAQRFPADLAADFAATTLLPPVGADEPLVRDYLRQFLSPAAGPAEFAPFVDGAYLRELFAEVKIEAGLGDPERWASDLPPDRFRALRERVDIDFAPTNRSDFGPADPVALDLFVKNVPTLLVKVYEVNAGHVYRTTGREIDTDLALDGLVANAERKLDSGESPLRRTARRLDLPELSKPGVYVVDLIGSGRSSRALVRKGRLRAATTSGPNGLAVRVFDDAGAAVPAATVWLAGAEYAPDKDGVVTLPYSTAPGRKPVVLTAGGLSSLDQIDHPGETYALTAGVHVERESLLSQRPADVLLRPGLTLNGRPVSLKLLENPRLRVVSTDQSGTRAAVEVPGVRLFEDRDTVQAVRVPPRLASLSVTLSGTVKSLSLGKPVELSVTQAVAVNGIDATDKLEALHLLRAGPDWVLELLGKTGEPRPDRAVTLSLKHREFKEPVQARLKTDAAGRVLLGPLADIVSVTATGPEGVQQAWPLLGDRHTQRASVHAAAGEVVRVPYTGAGGKPSRDEVALFEVRGDTVRADRFDAVTVTGGFVELNGLAAGDYDLHLKAADERVRVRIAAGPVRGGVIVGRGRQLEAPGLPPLQIASLDADAAGLTVRLANVSPFARVHVLASRYRPAFDAFTKLAGVRDAELGAVVDGYAPSVYLTGRDIGDEYRYVLDRQGKKRFPGVMVQRPQLLLNPWAVRPTESGVQDAREGNLFRESGGATPATPSPSGVFRPEPGSATAGPPADFPSLDFLADPATVLANLVPDKDGVVRVPRDKLGPHGLVQVVAVDPLSTTVRTLSLPEVPARVLDLRLATGLDPGKHFTQRREVTALEAGKPLIVEDVAGSRFRAYDSLASVYGLYATLVPDPRLAEFGFVTTWPKLSPEVKRGKYSEFASHELNFFLSKKDPEFFAAVVRPYLLNKKDKAFLDHYLLGDDLGRFAGAWEYGRLNSVERVLLGRRLPAERPRVARQLADALALQPARAEQVLVEFVAAADAGGLSADDRFAAKKALADHQDLNKNTLGLRADGPALRGAAAAPGENAESNAPAPPGAPKPAAPADPADRLGRAAGRRDGKAKDEAGRDKQDADNQFRFFSRVEVGKVRQLYRPVEPTLEWAENNYHKRPVAEQVAGLVPVGPLWAEWAAAGDGPFRSVHLASAARNFTEAMFALSVLDLPFDAPEHKQEFAAGGMTFTPAGPAVVFHEQVRPAAAPAPNAPVLVGQSVFRADDRFRLQDGERADKFVTGEFLTHIVYGSRAVVTNPTGGRQRLNVLVQLPVGAVPVGNTPVTRTVPLDLQPYQTAAVDSLFYFPRPGTFRQFPAHVSKGEAVVAAAPAQTFAVVAKPTAGDPQSWDWVSQNGTLDEVLGYLGRENVHALNLDKLAWRMSDRPAFDAVVNVLNERHAYSPTLWGYSLLHDVPAAARQFLQHADQLVAQVGGPLDSPLLTVDPVERHSFEHLEYKPLVNARSHALGGRREVVNAKLLEQYQRFLKLLTYRKLLTDADRLAVVYYLLVQDRVEEAQAQFAQVNLAAVATRLQYDYCAAYLALAADDPARARELAGRHAAHPVDRWRTLFADIGRHLDEADGKPGTGPADPADLARTEPAVEVAVADKQVSLTARNVPAVTLHYYLMDLELLFSRNPFGPPGGGGFATVKPTRTVTVPIPAGTERVSVPLPADLVGRNLLVEASAGGKTRSAVGYATTLGVTLIEGSGQLTATTPDGKPLPAAYVKVYARLADGSVKFHKDGYTDRRGRFDYATVSTPERGAVERFAVLVLHDARGAATREAAPPGR